MQLLYLHDYLASFDCKTLVVETHYIDRDHIDDSALFYVRNLRSYPNHCKRIHFFSQAFDEAHFQQLITSANNGGLQASTSSLQEGYLGFLVVRPLPGSPIGRTVLRTYPSDAGSGQLREFATVRGYRVHLAGFVLSVRGLAFQQQDRGVSACATTALWSALHRVAHDEGQPIPTPAEITQAASRYFLAEGRSLPSEGLTVHQISEAARASGLAPLVIRSVSPEADRVQILGYITSGFAPVLAIRPILGEQGHAICGVGVRLGPVQPQTDPKKHFLDAATAVQKLFVHDDRLGPYAGAGLMGYTLENGRVVTALTIEWPERSEGAPPEYELSELKAIIVPLPRKVRLSLTSIRALGLNIAQAVGKSIFPLLSGKVILNCRYRLATDYRAAGFAFGLSDSGILMLASELVMSRYVGVCELFSPAGPLFDVLIDSTETDANPSVLACVRRAAFPKGQDDVLGHIASRLGARVVL
jgi:hypothetical protein